MTEFEMIISIGFLFLLSSVFIGFYLYFIQRRKESRYDNEKKKIELDLLRHNLENQIYDLNERMMKNNDKWEDINNLQINGNIDINPNSKIVLNNFLKAGGINDSNIQEENFVFVLTPFHNKYDEVYNSIKNVCDKADIKCIRGDEENFKSDIFSHVLQNIVKAKVIIANLSGRNPNVLYELGIAHALDKTTLLISKLVNDLPVDIKSKRIIVYKNTNDLEKTLPLELLKVMK